MAVHASPAVLEIHSMKPTSTTTVPTSTSSALNASRPVLRGPALALLAAVLWSTGGVCVKLLDGYNPIAISAGRSAISAVLFLALLRFRPILPRRMRAWVLGGTITYAAVVISFVVSNRFTTAANAILLQYTAPLWIAFMGWVFIRERPSSRELLAMAIGGAGVLLCASEGITLFARDRLISQTLLGDAIALFSGFSFALLTVILRIMGRDAARRPEDDARTEAQDSRTEDQPASADPSVASPALVCLFYGNVLAALIGLPWFIADLSEPGMIGHPLVLGWGVLLWLGAGQLGLGYWFFQQGLRTTRALTASLLGLIEPVLNPVWVALLVGELPSKGTQLGGILVLISVVLSLTARRSRRS